MRLPSYPAYKKTGVEWLGEVPEHWEVKRLKHIFPRLESGVSVNSENYPSEDSVPGVLKTSCVYGDRFRPEENKRVIDSEFDRVACPVTKDSLIISRMNTAELVGSCGYVDRDYLQLFLPDRLWIARFTKKSKAYAKHLWYLIISHGLKEMTAALSTGTSGSMKNLAQDAFLGIEIPVPSVKEQRIIAEFLDVQTAKTDALLAKKRELIDKLKEKRTALISRTVTRGLPPEAARAAGIDPHPPMKASGIDWIGEIPEHWNVKKGRYLGILIGSIAPSEEDYTDDDDGTMFIKVDDLNNLDSKRNIISVTWRVKGFPVRRRRILLFPKRGAAIFTNKVAIAEGYFLFDTNLMGWQVYPAHEIRFIAYSLIARRLDDLADVSTVPQINNKHINPASFPVPPHLEQQAIADFIDLETARIDSMVTKVEEAIERLREYRTALITAAVTGKIDVRGAAA